MRELKINLGCGLTNKKESYLNVDIDGMVDPDITTDIRIVPWIWVPNGVVTLIEANNVAEHFYREEWLDIIKECHRYLNQNPEDPFQEHTRAHWVDRHCQHHAMSHQRED